MIYRKPIGGIYLDMDSFRYAVEVAECRNISAAARKLFITQPALTKHINKLESLLGTEIFERNATPLTITPAGEIFITYAKKHLALEQEMQERLDEVLQKKAGTVKLAVTSRGGWYIGKHMGPFQEDHPEIRLELINVDSKSCEEMLENGDADIGLYTDPVLSGMLEYVPLKKDPLIFAMHRENPILDGLEVQENSPEHPLEIDVERLRGEDVRFVLAPEQHSMHYSEQAFFERYRIVPKNPIYVDYIETRYAIACSGGGVVLIPLVSANQTADYIQPVFCVLKGDRLYRHIVIAKKRNARMSRVVERFWNTFIEEIFSNHEKQL